eukprot:GHVH01001159.1.p1 GENE.GHVH01001159.1~~GHVH01001159.1.p1  ORF type:complete len:191 (-),score=26.63 GHVH01001159.1:59-631(-)
MMKLLQLVSATLLFLPCSADSKPQDIWREKAETLLFETNGWTGALDSMILKSYFTSNFQRSHNGTRYMNFRLDKPSDKTDPTQCDNEPFTIGKCSDDGICELDFTEIENFDYCLAGRMQSKKSTVERFRLNVGEKKLYMYGYKKFVFFKMPFTFIIEPNADGSDLNFVNSEHKKLYMTTRKSGFENPTID